jgi:hypothetical protein
VLRVLHVLRSSLKVLTILILWVIVLVPADWVVSPNFELSLALGLSVAMLFLVALALRIRYGEPLSETLGTARYERGRLDRWLTRYPRIHRIAPLLALTAIVGLFVFVVGFFLSR